MDQKVELGLISDWRTFMDSQINHKTMRVIVGVIAILLAPTVTVLAGSYKTDPSLSEA